MKKPQVEPAHAFEILERDPLLALAVANHSLRQANSRWLPLARAQALVLRSHARLVLKTFGEDDIADVQCAINILQHHEKASELCSARGVLAQLLLASHRIRESTLVALEAFDTPGASAIKQCLAVRPALIALAFAGTSETTLELNARLEALLSGITDADVRFLMQGYVNARKFDNLLARLGIASLHHPFPASPDVLSIDEARAEAAPLLEELERLKPARPSSPFADPYAWLTLARLRGFVDGAPDPARQLDEVIAQASVADGGHKLATQGVLHYYCGKLDSALDCLSRALSAFDQERAAHGRLFVLGPIADIYAKQRRFEMTHRLLTDFHRDFLSPLVAVELRPKTAVGTDVWLRKSEAEQASLHGIDRLATQSEPPHLRRAIRFIQTQYHTRISVADIVAAAGVSRRALENAFRSFRQTTPRQALRDFRMSKGRDLLITTHAPISELSQALGYARPSMFARDFRAVYGLSPMDARRLET